MHICSPTMEMGPKPGLRAQKLLGRDLEDRSVWALGPGPGAAGPSVEGPRGPCTEEQGDSEGEAHGKGPRRDQ